MTNASKAADFSSWMKLIGWQRLKEKIFTAKLSIATGATRRSAYDQDGSLKGKDALRVDPQKIGVMGFFSGGLPWCSNQQYL